MLVSDNLEPQVHGREGKPPNYLNPDVEFVHGDIRSCADVFQAVEKALYTYMQLAGIIVAVLLRVYLPRFLGYIVLVERYLISSVVDLAYDLYGSSRSIPNNFAIRSLLRLAMKNTFLVLLKAREEDIAERRGRERFQDPIMLYEQLYGSLIVDTSNTDVKETQIIYEAVLSTLAK